MHGHPGSVFKSFETRQEAEAFIDNAQAAAVPAGKEDVRTGCHIFVDGSYEHATRRFSYGLVGFFEGERLEEGKAYNEPAYAAHRNVAGELYGAMRAMRLACERGEKELDLYYDYAGIEHWATGAWRTNTELTSKYQIFYKQIAPALAVRFHKIEAHTGHEHNERADQLAKQALKGEKHDQRV